MPGDDGLDCDCCDNRACYEPEGSPGWAGVPVIDLDGTCWPLDFAARTIGVAERDLKDLVRIAGLKPAGTARMSAYRRSGRQPRVYDAAKLIKISAVITTLRDI
jgi:hypothetical protein